jgi:hypothetical protein
MKKLQIIFAIILACAFSSCINIEEKIVINNDNTGVYSVSVDLSKMVAMLQQMNPGDTSYKNKKTDTVILLKGYIDTSKSLTSAEKAMYGKASMALKVDMPNNTVVVKMLCPFTGMNNLAIVKKNLFIVISKLDVTKEAESSFAKSSAGALPPGTDLSGASQSESPIAKYFTFASSPGKITYTINDKAGLNKEMASDSIAQMKQMGMLMGDFSYNSIFVLPSAVKKISGPGAVLSADKKTVTLKRGFDDLTNKPENLQYSIEY